MKLKVFVAEVFDPLVQVSDHLHVETDMYMYQGWAKYMFYVCRVLCIFISKPFRLLKISKPLGRKKNFPSHIEAVF